MNVVCVCLLVCLSVSVCVLVCLSVGVCMHFSKIFTSHPLQPPEEIEGDEELEELVKPPRPASPLDYTESGLLCEYIM